MEDSGCVKAPVVEGSSNILLRRVAGAHRTSFMSSITQPSFSM